MNFSLVDFKHNIDLKSEIRLSNLALNKELLVRTYLLKKIEKILLRKTSVYQYLSLIQILILYLNEPEKHLNKKSLDIFSKFIYFICKKFEQYKNLINCDTKNYLFYYRYIPEAYITYIIMYIAFNPNLITIAQLHEKKFFQDLIKKFLKVIKKSTNGQFDSSFMLGILIQIKDMEVINSNKKFISMVSTFSKNTYLDNNSGKGKVSVFNKISEDLNSKVAKFNYDRYNQTKNSVCDLAMDIIKLNFDTKTKYENLKPLIPIIFHKKEFIKKYNLMLKLNNYTNTFLNTTNAEVNNSVNNVSNLNILAEVQDEGSKGRNIINKYEIKNNRFTLENFVGKNHDNNSNINNFKLNKNKINKDDYNNEEEASKIHKNTVNNNLRKKVNKEIENDEESVKQEENKNWGNFESEEKPNKNNKKKSKVKNAPLKFYEDDESIALNLEKVFLKFKKYTNIEIIIELIIIYKIKEIENELFEESCDELEILPFYKKYKHKLNNKGVIAQGQSFYNNIENPQEESESDYISSDKDSVNNIEAGKKKKRINNANTKGKKKADNEEENLSIMNNKKKKRK